MWPPAGLLEETNASGVAQADYIYFNGRTVAVLNGSTIYFLHDDRLGTPQVASDNSQNIQWQASYEPFGTTTSVSGTTTQNLRFPGQYFDVESGWNHNGFRDYAPALGHYAEPDPLGRLGSGNNLYAYVLDNPANLVDPLGLCAAMISATNNATTIAANNFRKFMNCVANGANNASLAALLPSNAPSLLKNLAGNDFASLQQLVLGPDRSGAAVSVLEGKGTNALAQGIGSIPIGSAKYIVGENGAGTAYVRDVITPTISDSVVGSLVADLSLAKVAYDAGSYLAGFGTCAIWGK